MQFEGREEAWPLTLDSAGQSGQPPGSCTPLTPTPNSPLAGRQMLLCEASGCGRNNNQRSNSQRSSTHRPPAADLGTVTPVPGGPRSGWIVSDVTPTLWTLKHRSSVGGGTSAPMRMMWLGGPGTARMGVWRGTRY